MSYPLAIFGLGTTEMVLIAVVGLLIFGRRLPEVGRSLAKGIVEFKKGLKGVEEEIDQASSSEALPTASRPAPPPLPASAAYRFDPNTGKPLAENPQAAAPATGHKFDPYTGKPLSPEAADPAVPRQQQGA